MVLQRYALRFTISDATLDSLKLPRSTSKSNHDLNLVEHKTLPVRETETSESLQHKPELAVITKPEAMESDTPAQEETSDSVSSSATTPGSPPSPVINSELMPSLSLQLHDAQTKTTESPNTHQKEVTSEDEKQETHHTPSQLKQPHTTQPVHTLPSSPSAPSRPVPLLAAKPYCQPRSTQPGHKPVKVRLFSRCKSKLLSTMNIAMRTPCYFLKKFVLYILFLSGKNKCVQLCT